MCTFLGMIGSHFYKFHAKITPFINYCSLEKLG